MGNQHSLQKKRSAASNTPAPHVAFSHVSSFWRFVEKFKRNRNKPKFNDDTDVEAAEAAILDLQALQRDNGGLDGVFDRRTSANLLSPSPHTITRKTSDAFSFKSGGPDGGTWNEAQLLIFFDNVRQAIADVQDSSSVVAAIAKLEDDPIPSFRHAKDRQKLEYLLPGISKTLGELIEDEQMGQKPVTREFVVNTHIDRLLEEVVGYANGLNDEEEVEMQELGKQAGVLMELLVTRLKDIESARLKEMKYNGCQRHLQKIEFGQDWELHDEPVWDINNIALSTRAEGDLGFKPGQWWLNMYCCVRDGVVKSATEVVTLGRYGVTAMAMTEGVEVDGKQPGEVVFTIEGPSKKMPFALLTTKQAIRVIRGSRLKSPYAPEVGVRYDGLYKVVAYSHSSIPGQGGSRMVYRDKVVLKRVQGQMPFDTAIRHPTQSEVDMWDLYWGGVRVQMREWLGEKRFGSWCWVSIEEEGWRDRRGMRREKLGKGKCVRKS